MKKLMKIVYPVSTVAFGGVETFVRQTALFHDPSKVKPIYCFLKNGPLVSLMQSESSHDIRICPYPVRLRNPLSVIKSIFWLQKQIKESSADLVHSSMAYTTLFGAPASWLARVPHVWYQHGPVSGWMDQLAAILPSKAILYNSKYTMSRQLSLMNHLGFIQKLFSPNLKNYVLYLGAQSNSITEAKENKIPQIGMLCRFQKWKGIDLFIEAIKKVQEQLGKDSFQATLWGDAIDGQENLEYGNQIDSLCESIGINRVPYTSKPELAIQKLDILVNSSITPEPFGLTLIEAMQAGVIPVAPRWGGPLEIFEDQKSGLFFEPQNAADLAEKLITLIKNIQTRIQLSIGAKNRGMEKFSIAKTMHELETFYAQELFGNDIPGK